MPKSQPFKEPGEKAPQPLDVRSVGLLLAIIIGAVIVLTLGLVIYIRSSSRQTQTAKEPTRPIDASVAPPDLRQTGITLERARIQFVDRKDPSRLAGVMEWTSLQPLPDGRSLISQPRGYIYQPDGGMVLISAQRGTLLTPPGKAQPEAGVFEGEVTVRLFARSAVQSKPVNPEADAPVVTARTESMSFDLTLGEASTTDRFEVSSNWLSGYGRGFRILVNQVEEGIELLEVARMERLEIRPSLAANPLGEPSPNTLTQRQAAGGPLADLTNQAVAKIYRIVADERVQIVQGPRKITASRMETFARVIGNQLAPGAIGRFGPDPSGGGIWPEIMGPFQPGSFGQTAQSSENAPASPTAAPTTGRTPSPSSDDLIVVSWDGKMVMRPVYTFPQEFQNNQVAGRLQGSAQEPVKLTDGGSVAGISVAAQSIEFQATQRILGLTGTPQAPVAIDVAKAGMIRSKAASVNLATGLITAQGPGALIPQTLPTATGSIAANQASQQASQLSTPTLSWNQTLELQLASPGQWISPIAISAMIRGGMSASSQGIVVTGQSADVKFGQIVDSRAVVSQVDVVGNARATAPQNASFTNANQAQTRMNQPNQQADMPTDEVSGNRMTVFFSIDPETLREAPNRVEVDGNTRALARGLSMRAANLVVQIVKGVNGQRQVAAAVASGKVVLEDQNGLKATCDRVEALPPAPGSANTDRGIATLYGDPVNIARDGAVMSGQTVRLTQASGEVYIPGPGSLRVLRETRDGTIPVYGEATWQQSLTYQDSTGKAEAIGSIIAVLTEAGIERNKVTGDRLVMSLAKSGTSSDRRELSIAEVFGTPAKVEHRRYASAAANADPRAELPTERLIYLEGPSVIANLVDRSLIVPAAGKLLIDDRRPNERAQPGPAAQGLAAMATEKGRSLFTWGGQLNMSLASGVISMTSGVVDGQSQAVSFLQLRADTDSVLTLDCVTLRAILATTGLSQSRNANSIPTLEGNAALRRVEALDQVRVVSRQNGADKQEVRADRLIYDADQALIEVSANTSGDTLWTGGWVSFNNVDRPPPIQASRVLWNVRDNTIRPEGLRPVTISP